jgi:hypothetical protein
MILFKIDTTFKTLYCVAKDDFEARDRAQAYLDFEVRGPVKPMITNVTEVASTTTGRNNATLLK